nr:radical SAM protein [Candidatus Freyarchaeota archaeon]
MYACSPAWSADWISEGDLERVLTQLSPVILPSPLGPDRVGINYGLHFTGGEPFLNFDLLVKAVGMAHGLGIPSLFVETNSFWCANDWGTRDKFARLRDSGLDGLLISVNPFILEQVPFERTERAVRIGREVFGGPITAA